MRALHWFAVVLLIISPAAGVEFDSGRVVGRATDSAGKPVAGARVFFNKAQGALMDRGDSRETTTDQEGRYELTLRFEKDKTLLVREIFVEKEGYARGAPALQLPVRAGEVATCDFTLKEGQLLQGVLRLPLTAHEIAARQKAETIRRTFRVIGDSLAGQAANGTVYRTEPGGRFAIYLPRGEYMIQTVGYGLSEPEWKGIRPGQADLVLEPPVFTWSAVELERAFDQLWEAMDNHYSYFFLKPDVDWNQLRQQYRPQAIAAKNAAELAAVLQQMLAPLRDIHVWIETPQGTIPTYRSSYSYNGNFQTTLDRLRERTDCGRFAIVGKTQGDGFGYFLMVRQSEANPDDVAKAVDAVRKLAAAPGFIVDLRRAGGGSEPLAVEIAQQFCAADTVYAKSKRRSGRGHDEFSPERSRLLKAVEKPFTRPVVCLAGPGAVSSGEGFVKMMKCLPHVTTVGLPTRGASGNPRPWPIEGAGLTVYFSSWVDLTPDGRTFEGVGIPPHVEVRAPDQEYAAGDPTLEKGLEILRQKIAETKAAKQ